MTNTTQELTDQAKRFQKACETGKVGILEEILSSGNFKVDEPLELKWSGLQHACYNGKTEAAKYLLGKGANPRFKRSNDGMNVLHAAACSPFPEQYGAYDCCKLILEAGGKVTDKMSSSITPLIFAAKKGHSRILTLFLENGSDIDHQDGTSRNALDWACLKNHIVIVEILLIYGADVTRKNKNGWTAEQVAYYEGHNEIVTLFEEFLAKPTVERRPKYFVDDETKEENHRRKLLENIKQMRSKERDYLHLVLEIENLGRYFDGFNKRGIRYYSFLKMTEPELRGAGVANDDDRSSMVKLIKNLNEGVQSISGSCSHPVTTEKLMTSLDQMNTNVQLVMSNHEELKEILLTEDIFPSLLEREKELSLFKDFSLTCGKFNANCSQFFNSMGNFEEDRISRQERMNLTVKEEMTASQGSPITLKRSSGGAILRLSTLAGIMITLTFIAKSLNK